MTGICTAAMSPTSDIHTNDQDETCQTPFLFSDLEGLSLSLGPEEGLTQSLSVLP